MKQRRLKKRKIVPKKARSIDTRLKEMIHKRRPKLRSKVDRSPFRKSESKSESNGHFLISRLFDCQAGQLIALSILVDSLGDTVVALHPAIQCFLLLWAYRFLR